jgi:hopanoid-associated phosphorylase
MIVVVGLAFEARIAAQSGLRIICAGCRDLSAALDDAIGVDCEGLLSFGVAGGLKDDLPPGTCVIGSAVISDGRRFATDQEQSKKLLEQLPGSVPGIIVGAGAPVTTAAAKRALHLDTGAIVVDMESHVVADFAARRALPMTVVRVVCDPAWRVLPDIAFRSVRTDGTACIKTLLRSIARRPAYLPALIQLALDARSARASLMRCGRLLGPSLGPSSIIQAA